MTPISGGNGGNGAIITTFLGSGATLGQPAGGGNLGTTSQSQPPGVFNQIIEKAFPQLPPSEAENPLGSTATGDEVNSPSTLPSALVETTHETQQADKVLSGDLLLAAHETQQVVGISADTAAAITGELDHLGNLITSTNRFDSNFGGASGSNGHTGLISGDTGSGSTLGAAHP